MGAWVDCSTCDGDGDVWVERDDGEGFEDCPECEGSGEVWDEDAEDEEE